VSNSRNQGPTCIEPLVQEPSPGLPFDAPPDDVA
jgi:hypothetical protein